MRTRSRHYGFTLIELMVTLAVAAIALGIAIPSFQAQIRDNKSIAMGEDFATALNFARSEAIKRASRVTLCASDDGATCSGAWEDGFIAVTDKATTDKAADPDIDTVLRIWPKLDAKAVITAKSGEDNVSFVRFTSLGTLARVKPDAIKVVSKIEDCTGNSAREITVGVSGMVGIARSACTTNP